MIIHLDSDNPKPIEQKVQELILKKLYIKVKDELIFIDKEEFIALILQDVMAIAHANFDMDEALKIALQKQVKYKDVSEAKKNELNDTLNEFTTEIEAYRSYLDNLEEEMEDLEIYDEVLTILNSDYDLLIERLHQLMIQALGRKLSESDAEKMGVDRWSALDNFANQVKLIATNETMEDAVEEAYSEFEDYPDKQLVNKEAIQKELERFTPLAQEEINTYKLAISMFYDNAEFAMILATTKQMLQLN
jgi:hypothetical protein